MRRTFHAVLLSLSFLLLPMVGRAQVAHFWSQTFGGGGAEYGQGLATDAAGNLYVVGYFSATVDFGGGGIVSGGSTDAFVAKYDAQGVHQWSRSFGRNLTDQAFDVAVDAQGNVLLVGFFEGTVSFGGPFTTAVGGSDVFVVSLDPNGNHRWSRTFGGVDDDRAEGVAVDSSGAVYFTGFFQNQIDFGGGSLGATGQDVYLVKLDFDGNHVWSQAFGPGGNFDWGYDVDVAPDDEVVLAGSFSGFVDFGGGALSAGSNSQPFLARFRPDGQHIFSDVWVSTALGEAMHVSVDDLGRSVLTGYYQGSIDFGGGSLDTFGGREVFLAVIDPSGGFVWATGVGSPGNDFGLGVATDADGFIAVTGYYAGPMYVGGEMLASLGSQDVFVAKYTSDGTPVFGQGYGGPSSDYGVAVDLDGGGNLLLTGGFGSTVDFGGGPLSSAGSVDAYLLKLGRDPMNPTITSIVDVANDQGRWVRLRFERSGFDAPGSPYLVQTYEAYRRIDALPGKIASWEQVGSVTAHGDLDYAMVLPTLADSTVSDGMHQSVFYIRAATPSPFTYFDAVVDSGYSLDNLAPSAPANLLYDGGLLTWDESAAADFDYFTVYGSSSPTFGSGASVLGYAISPSLDVQSQPFAHYFVTATDFAGNEGPAATALSATAAPVLPAKGLSIRAQPNPFNPRTTLRLRVPADGPVRVRIFDTSGALVTTLHEGFLAAGVRELTWEGTDGRGHSVASGTYIARVEVAGQVSSAKLSLVK